MAQENYEDYEYLEQEFDTENIDSDDDSLKLNSQVFEEILILEVQEKPCLWDHRLDIKMRGMNIIRKAWEEVGLALNVDPKIYPKKWKNLRDTFLRKYKDEKSYIASGSAATKKAMNWKYYQRMQFLKPTAEHRITFSNIQMVANVNERLPEIRSRTSTEKRYIEETCIEDRPSPSLLTITDGNESISTLSLSLICKTAQQDTLFPSSPSSRGSTLSSTSCSPLKKKKSEVAVNITSQSKKSYTEYPDKFEEFIMGQVTQPESEAATFCNFIKTRLEKLERRYYLEAIHNIMNELMKLETKAEEETSKK